MSDEVAKESVPGLPTVEWSERELRNYLAKAWNQPDPSHVRVIGKIRKVEDKADGKPFGFLEDLHHPESGDRLTLPGSAVGLQPSAYVSRRAMDMVQRLGLAGGFGGYFLAELEPSLIEDRKSKNDPFLFRVRPASLEPLTTIPEGWQVKHIESEALPLILTKVRDAMADHLERETAEAKERLSLAQAALEATLQEKTTVDSEYEGLSVQMNRLREQISSLETEFVNRRGKLESGYRDLEALLREKGERMVALRLIDQSDLDKAFPPTRKAESRKGHSFEEALGGSLQQLAAYIQAFLWRKGMRYSRAQLLNFITLLRTNDLIVLAGDSGSGKTSLVKAMASAIGGRCSVIPVKPNWTGSEDLLGYYNPIERRYHPSPFLLALLAAAREPDIPHFICLDEMNLARVEYYFAEFLSLLESRSEAPWIHLYSTAEEGQAVFEGHTLFMLEEEARVRAGLPGDASFIDILKNPDSNRELRGLAGFQEADALLSHHAKIRRSLAGLLDIPPGFCFPDNVWIIGAINVDETTHYLSPKVLDRAHVMRFRNPVLVDWDKVQEELEEFNLDMDMPMNLRPAEVGERADYPLFDQVDSRVKLLVDLAKNYLDPLGIEFGLRAIRQSLNYMVKGEDAGLSEVVALNNLAVQKILPKIILDVEKLTSKGEKRRDVLIGLRDFLANALADLDASRVTESAVDSLDDIIARAEGNNGVANFWAR